MLCKRWVNRAEKTYSMGFTLIELLITLAIAGILMTIAVPSYTSFVDRSKMRAAQGDLVSLSVNIENAYQRTLAYPVINNEDSTALSSRYRGWTPSSPASVFVFSADANTQATNTLGGYILTATGQGVFAGCVITLNNENVRTTPGCPQGDGNWI